MVFILSEMEEGLRSSFRNVTHFSNVTIPVRDNEYEQSNKFVILAIYIALIFLIIPGNITIIIYMWKKKHFSNNFSVYATSLAVTDLSVGVFVLPLELAILIRPRWFSIVPLCIFLNIVSFALSSVSIFLLDVIAYDRYICVTSPLLYRSHVTKTRSVVLSIAMWILGFVIWIPYFVGQQFDDVYKVSVLGSCVSKFGYFTLGQAVLAYYFPTVFLVVVYILMLRALTKRNIINETLQKTRRKVYMIENELTNDIKMDSFINAKDKFEQIHDNIETDQGDRISIDRPDTSGISSEEPRLANKNHQTTLPVENPSRLHVVNRRSRNSPKYPQISIQNRACFKTISAVVSAFLLCWAPFFILWPMTEQCYAESRVWDIIYAIFSNLSFANSAVNPFIYVFTNISMCSEITGVYKRRRPVS